jgi:hypothetical protein
MTGLIDAAVAVVVDSVIADIDGDASNAASSATHLPRIAGRGTDRSLLLAAEFGVRPVHED